MGMVSTLVSLSFSVACADAYLTPCIQRYVTNFISGFKNAVSE